MKPQLSVLIITKNEARRLPALLRSLRLLKARHETVILDSDSTDGTQGLAKKWGARVISTPWAGYSATKNRGIRYCRAPWILSLDADEFLSPVLADSIVEALQKRGSQVYALPRLNHFLGRPIRHGGWYPDWQARLFKKGSARFNSREVHEGLETSDPNGQAGRLEGELIHDSYPDLKGYFQRLNRYTSLQAREYLRARGARPGRALLRAVTDPPMVLLKMLVLKWGFLDGARGWALAALSASSTFWKYAKYWHLSRQREGGLTPPPWVEGGR